MDSKYLEDLELRAYFRGFIFTLIAIVVAVLIVISMAYR